MWSHSDCRSDAPSTLLQRQFPRIRSLPTPMYILDSVSMLPRRVRQRRPVSVRMTRERYRIVYRRPPLLPHNVFRLPLCLHASSKTSPPTRTSAVILSSYSTKRQPSLYQGFRSDSSHCRLCNQKALYSSDHASPYVCELLTLYCLFLC